MRFPSPAYRQYLEFVATALVTVGLLQYLGVFGASGEVDATLLAGLILGVPVFTYVLTLACENVSWIPRWERMVQRDE